MMEQEAQSDAGTAQVRENVQRIQERIEQALARAGRPPRSVTLIGVTKRVELERIRAAARAGVYNFGENYLQEAREKIPQFSEIVYANNVSHETIKINWHLIGQLQSNKAKLATELFDTVQTVDRLSLAQELNRHALMHANKVLPVLLEVNLSEQKGRGGALPEHLYNLFEQVAGFANLSVQGLMGIAPFGDAEEARPYFKRLYKLWDGLPAQNRCMLSMGMSGDFEEAIEEGATQVRIGTALFGARR